jgi:putative colanic acid biosynthesis acetyltransferase WcaF
MFGAKVASNSRISPSAKFWAPWNLTIGKNSAIGDYVDCYCVERVTIGDNAIVSQYSYLCAATHDFTDSKFPLVPQPITIGDSAWIAADVFVGPGVTIGDGAVIGARSSVFKNIPEWVVATGSPAKAVRVREIKTPSSVGMN